jgi:hypothetical protein
MANVHEYALTLGIDGTLIPVKAVVKLTQTYDRAGGRNLLRMRSGRGVMQSRWEKVRSDIAATGWMPAAGRPGSNHPPRSGLRRAQGGADWHGRQ